ncbi:PIN domain-containing protein [Ephemerocybe angulata]|uniref:PIN domain-containing protein n=1 Tax=Ephemerocybe angulata TaxID=980116 RepID=A0A8H6MBJ2_9AGAR|nr:PIN domain-containing protein [Tulosesus angulatus]
MASSASYTAFIASNFAGGQEAPPIQPPSDLPQATSLQATLTEINIIANDVDMQPPPSEWGRYIIMDTNILLGHYEALRTFVEDIEKLSAPILVVVPGIVVQELDRQKNRDKLAWPARRASGWLLEKVRAKKGVKVQATEETCKPSGNWRTRMDGELTMSEDMMNDHLIIDCAEHFQRRFGAGHTFLCSADNNLGIIANAQGLPIITPPRRGLWTSRDIAKSAYGMESPVVAVFSSSNLAQQPAQQQRRQDAKSNSTGVAGVVENPAAVKAVQVEETDSMLIDDEDADALSTEETPLNVLHDDVREFFTRLLVDLAGRVGASGIRPEDVSVHAPAYVKRDYRTWSAAEALDYLYDHCKGVKKEMRSPAPEVFLSKRYSARGARTGQEWSPADWRVGLENLNIVGAAFGEKALSESVKDLQAYLAVALQTIRR